MQEFAPTEIESIFHAARIISDPDDQAHYLDRACHDDVALRSRVEALLKADKSEQDVVTSGSRILDLGDGSLHQTLDTQEVLSTVDASVRTPPIQINRFTTVRTLGRGGFGQVYLAFDELLRRQVAIKVPSQDLLRNAEQVDAFLKEAQALAKLDHPNIVPVYEFGRTSDGRCFLVEKFIEGGSLSERLEGGPLSVDECTGFAIDLAEALHYVHTRGLVHRDVKPGNILIGEGGIPVLTDFGIALHREDYGRMTNLAGSTYYMSPEQARHEGHLVDGRSDIFSLGIVLYEALTGERPFGGSTVGAVLDRIRSSDPQPLRRLNELIPKELERICLRALSKRATDRYSTALDLADDLRAFRTSGVSSSNTRSTLNPMAGAMQRQRSETTLMESVIPRGLRSYGSDDAGFFVALLPGPRDRNGLPESIAFWKSKIEDRGVVAPFRVGLMYGPSGCGKSSIVKAGLLPNLAPDITSVFVEANGTDTEARLLRVLRHHFDDLKHESTLLGAMGSLRTKRTTRLLICIDQFEQWLYHNGSFAASDLVDGLRQCDGVYIQCLILTRDDFWMATSRFFHALEIRLVEKENSFDVDLFDAKHARRVLTAFGLAHGALNEPVASSEDAFVAEVVEQISNDGLVVPVRLAICFEMIKNREWSRDTLKTLGGTRGIGVKFLDESFSSDHSPPEYRIHEEAARRVLAALLPSAAATGLKGRSKAPHELLEISGYRGRPEEFQRLIEILERNLRLISPVDTSDPREPKSPTDTTLEIAYQLTHDELVIPIREWLTCKSRESFRGRALLTLREHSDFWNSNPRKKYLPSLVEYLFALLFSRTTDWSTAEQKMMWTATKVHATRAIILVVALMVVAGPLVWKHLRLPYLIEEAQSLWNEGPENWSRVCDLLEEAYEIEPAHTALESMLSEISTTGSISISTESSEAIISITPLPGPARDVGVRTSPSVLSSVVEWRSGQRIPVTTGHYNVTVTSGPAKVEFPIFVGQRLYRDVGDDWRDTSRVHPERVEAWAPTGDERISSVLFAEAVTLAPISVRDWPGEFEYVPPGDFWRSKLTSRTGIAVNESTNAVRHRRIPLHRLANVDLENRKMENGYIILRSEVSGGDYYPWRERTKTLRWNWLVQQQVLANASAMVGIPLEIQRRHWREKYNDIEGTLETATNSTQIARAVARHMSTQSGELLEYRISQEKRWEERFEELASEPGDLPAVHVDYFLAQDYARTFFTPDTRLFSSWCNREIQESHAATVQLSQRLTTLQSPLFIDSAVQDLRRIPHYDAQNNLFGTIHVVQAYRNWLEYDLHFLGQVPSIAISNWAHNSRSPLITDTDRELSLELMDLASREPWTRLSDLDAQIKQIVVDYANAIGESATGSAGAFVEGLREQTALSGIISIQKSNFQTWCEQLIDRLQVRSNDLARAGEMIVRDGRSASYHALPWELRCEHGASTGWGIPTIDQWEKAARGVDHRIFPWGNGPGLRNVAFHSNAYWPVGSAGGSDDVSPYNVLHMAGNVSEWIETPTEHRTSKEQIRWYLKGGNLWDSEQFSRIDWTLYAPAAYGLKSKAIGFRVARTILP